VRKCFPAPGKDRGARSLCFKMGDCPSETTKVIELELELELELIQTQMKQKSTVLAGRSGNARAWRNSVWTKP